MGIWLDPLSIVRDAQAEFSLTRREVDILYHLLQGKRSSEIAAALSIAPSTVTDYTQRLLEKTASNHRGEMVAKLLGWREP